MKGKIASQIIIKLIFKWETGAMRIGVATPIMLRSWQQQQEQQPEHDSWRRTVWKTKTRITRCFRFHLAKVASTLELTKISLSQPLASTWFFLLSWVVGVSFSSFCCWGSDFKQTSGCNVTSAYTELNLSKNTLWSDHYRLKGCSITIFLLYSNMRGLRIFIYYVHNFDNVNGNAYLKPIYRLVGLYVQWVKYVNA